MNIENAKTLVGQLKRLPDEKFNMATVISHDQPCGTVACIAGWASILNGGPQMGSKSVVEWASNWLNLYGPCGCTPSLFIGGWDGADHKSLEKVTRSEAIAELERRIEAAS